MVWPLKLPGSDSNSAPSKTPQKVLPTGLDRNPCQCKEPTTHPSTTAQRAKLKRWGDVCGTWKSDRLIVCSCMFYIVQACMSPYEWVTPNQTLSDVGPWPQTSVLGGAFWPDISIHQFAVENTPFSPVPQVKPSCCHACLWSCLDKRSMLNRVSVGHNLKSKWNES